MKASANTASSLKALVDLVRDQVMSEDQPHVFSVTDATRQGMPQHITNEELMIWAAQILQFAAYIKLRIARDATFRDVVIIAIPLAVRDILGSDDRLNQFLASKGLRLEHTTGELIKSSVRK